MKIGIYVQSCYAKANYKQESFNIRLFAGIEVVADTLRRGGHETGYCSEHNVDKFDVVLVTITAQCDWFSFIAERERWPVGKYKVVVGGAGMLNVRPFLPWFDVCVWGRAENIICGVVRNIDSCHLLGGCVAESKKFNPNEKYKINQADGVYPHEIGIGGHTKKEQVWQETGIGCKRKCKFCAYTWHRKNIVTKQSYSNDGLDVEFTMLDLDMSNNDWCKKSIRSIGLDGVSEKLRLMVNKPISNELLHEFIRKKAKYGNGEQVKFFNVVGYPGESEDDYLELLSCLKRADDSLGGVGKMSCLFGFSPFRAMPATPAALWPMSKRDFRKQSISKFLKKPTMPGNVFFQGKSIWAVEWMGTDSLSGVMVDAIALRGTEEDIDNVGKISRTKKFWSASAKSKKATIENCFDVDALFSEYALEKYPVRYLESYVENKKIMKKQNA
jgi:hypothetical protein